MKNQSETRLSECGRAGQPFFALPYMRKAFGVAYLWRAIPKPLTLHYYKRVINNDIIIIYNLQMIYIKLLLLQYPTQ